MARHKHLTSLGKHKKTRTAMIEALETRRLLAAVTLDPGTTYQTIQGWGTAAVYPTNLVTVAQAGTIMRDAGMNVVRVTPGPNDYTYTVGGNMRTPVPISANLDQNVARFNPNSNNQTDLINWLETNALEPSRVKMIGSLWSPPYWMKITTGTLMNWDNGGPQSGYDPIIPWGDYGANTGAGRVNPTMWTDWARYVLSAVKWWQQKTGLPMYAFSFQNEPNVPATYNSATFDRLANDVNNPSAGYSDGHWDIYGDAVQALATELASHPEITTKFFGPELSQLGGGATNPYNLPSYNAVRQNLISRGLLNTLGAYATHEYTYPADDAVMWDAWYNGSAHAANIVNGTNNLGWLGPTPGIAGDNKEIWQTETEGEDQTWTKDGAMGFGLKIFNSLVYGNVSGYTSWTLTSYNAGDAWGLVDVANITNPTNSYKYDAFKQFSRWIRPGAQRINATFANGKASTGGANALDSYNGLNVAAFKQAQDKRLTMVFVNMQASSQSTTITIPASVSCNSYQVYETTGSQKYVQLADLIPSNGTITITVPASSFVTITGSYAATTLPAPWVSNDIGSPSPTGSAGYNATTGTFTVSGSGSDIWNNSDQFQFVSRSVSGDGTLIARANSVQNTNTWAKAGVMFRDSTAAGAMFADVVVTPSSGVSFQWRNSTGGNCGYAQILGVTAPAWVKLVRTGSSFTAFYATTTGTPADADWIQVGTAQTIAMGSNVQAGLAVTSHASGSLSTSTFSGVQTLIKGDINGDGYVGVADISALMNALANLDQYKTANSFTNNNLLAVADIDRDLAVTNLDIQSLIVLLANSAVGQGASAGGSAGGGGTLEPNLVGTSSVTLSTAPLAVASPLAISTSLISASAPAEGPPAQRNILFPVSFGSDANLPSVRTDLAGAYSARTRADSSNSPRDRHAEAKLQIIIPLGRMSLRRAAHQSNPLSLEALDRFFAGGD